MMSTIDLYLQTPRHITRLVNAFKVIWAKVRGDVDLTDLLAITTLQLFEPKIYAFIRDQIETITHADHRSKDDKEVAKRMELDFSAQSSRQGSDRPRVPKRRQGVEHRHQ